jgi:competence protein ComEC
LNPLKFPLIGVTISFIIGIILQEYAAFSLSFLFYGILISAVLFGFAWYKNYNALIQNTSFGFATHLFSATLGMFTYFVHVDKNTANHYSKQTFETTNAIKGVIQTALKPNERYVKYVLDINGFNTKIASGKILLYVPKQSKIVLQSGAEISINEAIYPIPKAYNPYQFNYANYLEKQNIGHQIYLNNHSIKIIKQHQNFNYYIEKLRNALSDSFAIHHFDAKTKAIIDALLLGQRVAIDKETLADYSNAGVIHILAISGLHISILYFFLVFLLKPLRSFRFGKEIELLLVLFVLWLFAFLTGLPASVTRAVTLFSLISVGTYFNQSKAIYNAMATSALLILLFSPNAIFDIGFQLSYAAVLSIVLFQPFYKKFHITQNKIALYFIDLITVSMAAQIGVLPLSLYYFNQLPLLFLLANLVIIPLSSFVLLYGIVLLIFNFVAPEFSIYLGKLLSFSIRLMNDYIHWIAHFKSGIITNISFSVVMVCTLYLVLTALLFWMYAKKNNALIYVVLTLFVFQLSYLGVKWNENESSEFLVFNEKQSLIAIKNQQNVIVYTNDFNKHKETLQHYLRGTFSDSLQVFPMQNVFSFQQNRIMVIDSFGVYKSTLKPSIIILTQNPKINLDRLIKTTQPKVIIADKSNYKNTIKRWEATCRKAKIPFHAIAEKGFYRLK